MRYLILLLATAAAAITLSRAAENDQPEKITPAQAAKRATVPAGMTVSLWAAEPLLANPVALSFDERGRCYIAETTRFDHGVPDTRDNHLAGNSPFNWLDDDIASRTVADRLAMYKKFKYGNFEKFDDQLRCVWDSAGKGVADKSAVVSKGYNKPEDGLAAGVLARGDDVFFACVPSLYRFRIDGDKAAQRDILSTGYGIHVQLLGHDLHGLRIGPDGRLYFSMADRGFNVVNKEGKRLLNPDSGGVLRCDLDGSNLEMVHTGLRNPQKLAFDDFGNLFTFDNNSDSGDLARWVQIVPGGDSGWRCGYQYPTLYHTPDVKQGNRGPWNTDKLWHLPHENQPAYIVPPLAHFGSGPSGIVHYPGIGLNDKYRDHFFACDFTASPGSSLIWSLAVKPKGASFEVIDLHRFVQNMLPTDCEFGPDSNFYWCDWVNGWNPVGNGRIFKVTDPEAQNNPVVHEARELLARGMKQRSNVELIKLLDHPHQWVRQEAQFELASTARRAADVIPGLAAALKNSKNQITRLHAVWGLGQICRRERLEPVELAKLLQDENAAIRGAAAQALAESANASDGHWRSILGLLHDPEPAVQAKAAYAAARFAKTRSQVDIGITALIRFLRDEGPKDPYLRQAAVVALASFGPVEVNRLVEAFGNASPAATVGFVAMLRRIGSADVEKALVKYLHDESAAVTSEAAMAIYDERLMGALPALAELATRPKSPDAVAFRALAANFLLGRPEDAQRLADFAARPSEPDYRRAVALKLLADWPAPKRLDPITGLTIDLKPRDAVIAKAAIIAHLDAIFSGDDNLRKEAVDCVRRLGISEVGPMLAAGVADEKLSANVRVDALYALEALNAKELDGALATAATSAQPKLKGAARVVRIRQDPATAGEFSTLLDAASTSLVEKQMLLAALAHVPESSVADKTLANWLDRLAAGEAPAELRLEIVEAGEARAANKDLKRHADLKSKLQAYEAAVKKAAGEKLDKSYPEALAGGDAERGRSIFLNNVAVSCQRCHKLDGQGGDVGPPLNGVGAEKTREYLLEAIVVPNAQIAQGYQSVILNLANGKTVSGILRKKTKEGYTLITPDDKTLQIAADEVENERPDRSAMPDDLYKKLSRRELRDLVEFLASLKKK